MGLPESVLKYVGRTQESVWLAKMAIWCSIRCTHCVPRLLYFGCKSGCMVCLLRLLLVLVTRFSWTRRDLLLENLALRQQLITFYSAAPRRVNPLTCWVVVCSAGVGGRNGLSTRVSRQQGGPLFTRTYINTVDPATGQRPFPLFGLTDYIASYTFSNFHPLPPYLRKNFNPRL